MIKDILYPFLSFLSALAFTLNTHAFVHQKTVNGDSFTWAGASSGSVNIYVNGANSSGISERQILSRASQSATQWNQTGGPLINILSTSTGPYDSRNDVYFTSDSSAFAGSSVLAVTQSVYNSATGRIIEADILIKDTLLFSNDSNSDLYIGDLLSHEMGHLIGLDHSTMPFSTMFYKLIRGQHTISFDDTLGKKTLYGQSSYSGKISGKIAGGADQVAVFGADVKLISSTSGMAIASTLSGEDGSYIFDGVPLNDVYYIYIAPFKALDTVSKYYQTVKTDFCSSFEDFRGSFYQGCGNSRSGHPMGIELNSTTPKVDTGVVTIKCGIDVPTGYMSVRGTSAYELDDKEQKKGDSFVGFFSSSDVQSQNADEIYIDLSDVDTSDGNYYLDLRLISQELYSRVDYTMYVTSALGTYNYGYGVTTDNTPNLNLNGRIALSSSHPEKNIFTIRITPRDFDQFMLGTSFHSESLFFPDFSTFGDNKFFYQFIYYLSKEQNNGEIGFEASYSYTPTLGNARCMEAEETYSVKAAGSVTGITNSITRSNKKAQGALACGTVAFSGDNQDPPNGNGPMTVMVGFLLTFLLSLFKNREQH